MQSGLFAVSKSEDQVIRRGDRNIEFRVHEVGSRALVGREDRSFFAENLFSFDQETIFNFWTDYPDKLTPEQIEIFKKENPTMAELK